MRRLVARLALAIVLAGLLAWLLLPPSSVPTAPAPANVARGAYHIHTNRSDGSGTPDAVAQAAAHAGLQFVILTDHGDGTRVPDPPVYRSGVLTIDAVELNTTAGHYVALGLPATPYPLAGTPAAVIEDVKRLGGFGIAAHPGSPRPSLQWTDWNADIDALEWINGDSEWRDEARLPLARALLTFFVRPPEAMAALLDRPAAVLDEWDRLTRSRRVAALAGIDAHAWLGDEQDGDGNGGFHLPIPGYEATFRTFSNHVVLDAPFTGDAARDAMALLDAIRGGRTYSVIDALASPGGLSFTATSGGHTVSIGGELAGDGDVQLRAAVTAPPGTVFVLLKNGQRTHEVAGSSLEMNGGSGQAVYRIEVFMRTGPGTPPVPWIVSNPIYAGFTRAAVVPFAAAPPDSRIPAQTADAAVESGAIDASTLSAPVADSLARRLAGDAPLLWTFTLGPGTARGQFAAVRVPITGGLAAFDRVRFRVKAAAPSRAWVQLRAPGGERWGTTFYADQIERIVDLPLSTFLPIGVTSSTQPPLDRMDSLLFVADTLNFLPGSNGSMVLSDVAFVR